MLLLVILLLASWVGYCVVKRCGGVRPAGGFLMKTLGVVAVLAGIGVLVRHNDREEEPAHVVTVSHDDVKVDLKFPEGFDHGDFLEGNPFDHLHLDHGRTTVVPSGLIIVLGSGLIILGAMLFGRERTRPFALKALTFLGVGAIIYSVGSFFGEPPRAEPTVRMVHADHEHADHAQVEHEQHIAKRPTRPTRAKRPSLRPDRPSSTSAPEVLDDFLPPRAGEIPVAAELAKVDTSSAQAQPAQDVTAPDVKADVKVIEPQVASPQVDVPSEPAAPEAPAAAPQPAPETPPAQPAPAAAAPAAEQPPAEAQPVSESPAVVVTEVAAKEVAVAKPTEEKPTAEQPADEKPAAPAPAEAQPAAPAPVAAAPTPQPVPAAVVAPAIVPSQPRPSWVDRAPGLSDGVYLLVVSSGPYSSVPECQHALNEEILTATKHYINEYLGDENAAALVNLPVSFAQQIIKKQEYAETIESPSVGRMQQLHAQLQFDDHARNVFQQRWRTAVVQDRLWYTGGGAALVLALLATFYGYLKLDLKTDAPHKGRLQLAATLVALLVAAGALLARWAVPF